MKSSSEGHIGVLALPSKVNSLPDDALIEVLVVREVDIERFATIPDAGWDILDLSDDPISLRLEVLIPIANARPGDLMHFRVCREKALSNLIARMRSPLLFVHGHHPHEGTFNVDNTQKARIKRIQLAADGKVAVLPDLD